MNGGTIAAIVGALVALIGVFTTPIQDFITAHPAITAVLGGVGTIVAALLKPPAAKP